MSIKEKYQADLIKINALMDYVVQKTVSKYPSDFPLGFEISDTEVFVKKHHDEAMMRLHAQLFNYKTALETKIASL